MLQNIDERHNRIRQYQEDLALARCQARAWRDIADHITDTYTGGNQPARDAKLQATRLLENMAEKYDAEAAMLTRRLLAIQDILEAG